MSGWSSIYFLVENSTGDLVRMARSREIIIYADRFEAEDDCNFGYESVKSFGELNTYHQQIVINQISNHE